jgi:hypothetical protein
VDVVRDVVDTVAGLEVLIDCSRGVEEPLDEANDEEETGEAEGVVEI